MTSSTAPKPTVSDNPLPEEVPLFSVSGIILLPHAHLPLRIFEPHYVSLFTHALSNGRMVGIIQPKTDDEKNPSPSLYQMGCLGKIITFSETEGGHFLVTLQGISRFDMKNEKMHSDGFRLGQIDVSRFTADQSDADEADYDRAKLTTTLRIYCDMYGVSADWSVVQSAPIEDLISSLAMICPFSASEKQALLEAPSLQRRAETITTLLEMACLRHDENSPHPRH